VRARERALIERAHVSLTGRHTDPVRVLLVEDDADLADTVALGLRAEGFSVDVAADGDVGLWQAQEHRYGAIVLDIMLPGRNGYRVCRELRAAGDQTPILVLTAKQGAYDEAEALDMGADDFLSKPFAFVVLVARLRALARRANGSRAPVLRVGDLELDPATRRCARGRQEVALTPREHAVLEALLRRPGEVVRRADLLAEVWGHDHDGQSNVVDVYVGYVRRKVDHPFGRRTIETVRGVGFRVVDDDGG
jgi:two-component system OmpR family response regulator